MKQRSWDVDSIPRWRDRPPGGASDEDRAAALARDALVPGAFPVGLDDRRLVAIEESLQTGRRASPPFWLRPALVAALLTVSVASVMGYETSWFAPLRERLRYRSVPPARPEPIEQAKKRAARSEAGPTEGRSPQVGVDIPAPEVLAAESAGPESAPPVTARARVAKSVSASPIRKVAVADPLPPEPPAVVPAEPPAPSEEIQSLERAMGLLRGKHDAPAALAALDDYIARFPSGVLVREARVARIDALLTLSRAEEALQALETMPLDAHRRSTELQLIRAELRARTDCRRAEVDFTAVLTRVPTGAMEERALYGRAACRSTLGEAGGAADDLRRYVEEYPTGAHADWARRWLQNRP